MGIYDDDLNDDAVVDGIMRRQLAKKKIKTKPLKKKSPPPKKKKKAPAKKKKPPKKKPEVAVLKEEPKKGLTAEEFFASIEPIPVYEKHLIECRCFLPQFKNLEDPPGHRFVVFSELDQAGKVIPSYAQCNNCGIIHRVIEVCQSTTIKKETMQSLSEIDDYKPSLPDWAVGILEKYKCELHVWQEAEFIYRNKQWGKFVVIAKEREDDVVIGKILIILGENIHKIDTFEQDDPFV